MTMNTVSTPKPDCQVPTSETRHPASAYLRRGIIATVLTGLFVAGCARDPVGAAPSAAPAPNAPTEPSKATTYKCPMHPNVTSDKPGKCPECGMNLEKSP